MEFQKKPKILSRQEAYLKACSFCAYQERNHEEVRQRLMKLRIFGDEAEEIITDLIRDNYLNEERYAQAYAGGKFRIKNWGRIKIMRNLEQKGISKYCIKKGLAEISDDDYAKSLRMILEKRKEHTNETDMTKLKFDLANYALAKGYESDLVWDAVSELISANKSTDRGR